MAGRKKKNIMHVAHGVTEERKAMDWIVMKKRMESARRIKPGWHTFYVIKEGPGYAVAVKRKLTNHYEHHAHFISRNGFGESFTYAELANMIAKPEGMLIITEAEEKRRNMDE